MLIQQSANPRIVYAALQHTMTADEIAMAAELPVSAVKKILLSFRRRGHVESAGKSNSPVWSKTDLPPRFLGGVTKQAPTKQPKQTVQNVTQLASGGLVITNGATRQYLLTDNRRTARDCVTVHHLYGGLSSLGGHEAQLRL